MPKFKDIRTAIRDNERRECSVKHCTNKRYRIGSLCERCGRQKWLWGHPEAKAVYKRDYAHEKKMVEKVIGQNLEHEGIQHGLKFLADYMERSANGATYLPGHKHAKRLHDSGTADPVGILTELSAIYMLSQNFHTPVKDHKHLKYLLGNKFIRYVPCHEKVRGTEHRDVGEYLNENIGVLLLNIANSAHKMAKKDQEGTMI